MTNVVSVGPKSAGTTTATPRTRETAATASGQKGKRQQQHPAVDTAVNRDQLQSTEQQQSLAMVQIMLHASFGALFYLREFLPLSCFGDCDLLTLSNNSGNVSYEDFSGEKPSSHTANVLGKRGQPLKTILRNHDEKADCLLDLLEQGIFEALSKNVLEAVQLTVFVDKEQPTRVLESYTFSFKYTGDVRDVNSRLATISLEPVGFTAEMKTFRSAKHGLEMIIRRLITLSTFLPILPNKRYMEIHLFYTEDCPPDYEPPGFRMAAHDPLVYPQNELWTRETQSCGTMNSGFHSVGLKVSSLKSPGDEQGASSSRAQIPETIDYSEGVDRDADVGLDHFNDVVLTSCSQESTQTRQAEEAKRTLQKMFVSSTQESDFILTQINPDSVGNSGSIAKPQLSQMKISEIRGERNKTPSVNHLQSTFTRCHIQAENASAVNCQCGWDNEDGDMIQCAFCSTWQHSICYGFLHANDPKIPDTHICYKCLLGSEESTVLREMDTLVLLRRALKVISEEGYPNRVRDFAQKLHCNGNTIVQITDLLKKQGFLQATPGSKSKGFLLKGLPKFKITDSPPMLEKLRDEIFNPLAKISHHYIIPQGLQSTLKAPESLGDSLMERYQENEAMARETSSDGVSSDFSSGKNKPGAPTSGIDSVALASSGSQNYASSRASSTRSRRRRQRNMNEESQELGVPETQQSREAHVDGRLGLRKKRKLSNVASPLDICDPMDEDSS